MIRNQVGPGSRLSCLCNFDLINFLLTMPTTAARKRNILRCHHAGMVTDATLEALAQKAGA